MEKIRIENFGPIKKANLELKRVIVFIGPQSSGKSTIAKLITIFRNFSFVDKSRSFEKFLESYNIHSYISKDTNITYQSKNYIFSYSNLQYRIEYINEDFSLLVKEHEEFDPSHEKHQTDFHENLKKVEELTAKIGLLDKETDIEEFNNCTKLLNERQTEIISHLQRMSKSVDRLTKIVTFSKYSIYIPSERSLFSIFSKSIFSLLSENIILPEIIKSFGSLMEKALANVKEFDIDFLKIKYVKDDNDHFIIESKSKRKIPLSETSSGFQTILPLMIVLEGFSIVKTTSLTFVVEEPELNLFPAAQYELIKLLIEKCSYSINGEVSANDLIVTTHSPYCLSAFNNCLLAGIQGKQSTSINKIIAKKSWLNPDDFVAYELNNGKARNIIDKTSKLIDENYLDQASEIINSDFNAIFQLYKEVYAE